MATTLVVRKGGLSPLWPTRFFSRSMSSVLTFTLCPCDILGTRTMQFTDYISMNTLRNVLDIALVFIIVYVVLKLLRGTRAVPTVVGLILLGLLYWLALAQDFATLEFVLRYAVVYVGFAIIVLFQS